MSSVTPAAAWWSLGVLTFTMLLAVLDRAVLTLQADTIRQSLGLSDFQLGFLQGTAVALVVGLVSYPLGWLADRFDRRWVLVGCVVFWSIAVAGSGLAQNYPQLLLGSALVGAGEAGLLPVVNSLIPVLFQPRQRQMANSVFAISSTAVSAIGLGLTGAVIGLVDVIRQWVPGPLADLETWRLSFLLVALPAPLVVLLILTIANPARPPVKRSPGASVAGEARAASTTELLPYLSRHRALFVRLYGGYALVALGFGAVGGWMAVIYQRVFHQKPEQLGAVLGTIGLGTTAAGFVLSVYGLRYFASRVGPTLNVRVIWIAALTSAACFAAMTLAREPWHMYAIHGVFVTLMIGATMVWPTVIQGIAPDRLRGRIYGLASIVGSCCVAAAPPVVGLLSDQLTGRANGLVIAAAAVSVPCLLLGAALLRTCEQPYVTTRAAAEREDLATRSNHDA